MQNERLLRITGRGFCAGAVFTRVGQTWRCTQCAPILRRWMLNREARDVHKEILHRRLAYEWVKQKSP